MHGLRTFAAVTATVTVGAFALIGASPPSAARPAGETTAAAPARIDCGGESPVKPGGGRYRCTFEENFDGTALDTSRWMVQETWFSAMTTGNQDCYLNRPDVISVSGGMVHLTSRTEPAPFTCHSPLGDFTSQSVAATIVTRDRFVQTYGRFEFRAKFPDVDVQGIHSTLWLYPQRHTYGAWPHSGEIDVAERFSGYPSHVFPAVHYSGENIWESVGFDCPMPDSGTRFHRYAVEWTSTAMRFLYDGRLCFQHAWTPDAPLVAPQPFDHPFYFVLTQAFGGDWNRVTEDTPGSATMQVDWVRAWR